MLDIIFIPTEFIKASWSDFVIIVKLIFKLQMCGLELRIPFLMLLLLTS